MIRYWLLVFTLGLAVATTGLAQSVPSSSEASATNWERLKQQVSVRTSLHVEGAPLDEVVNTLHEIHGITILIDAIALEDLGLDPNELVSVEVRDAPLAAVLDAMLRPIDLDWTFQHHAILITSEDAALTSLITRVYPVPDLLGTNEHVGDYDSLIDAIISTIASDSWVENGGAEAEVRPFPAARVLVISQTVRVHWEIEQLLADLRRVRSAQGRTVYRSRSSGVASFDRAPRARNPRTYIQPLGGWRVPRSHGNDGT